MKKQSYTVLARKYRPQGFAELLGQPAVSMTLKNALTAKRLHHAYLFTGPRGVGKTTMARILAKALNCVNGPTPEPCGDCDPCREIAASSCLDVLEMDAASNTGVDNVRQVIIETVGLAPSRDRYKVFIIDEAHMLSTAAFNALLKTLEEPPPHVAFVLATTEAAKVPSTIASRCQRFKFRPVPVELLAKHLAALAKKEKIEAEPAALELLARSAEGSLRDAVSLLDQCHSAGGAALTEELVREMFGFVAQELLLGVGQALAARDAKSLASWLKRAYEEGVEPAQLLRDLRAALEAVYLERLGIESTLEPPWKPVADALTAETASFYLRRLNRTLEELRFGDSPRLVLELGLFGCLESAADLQSWVERLEALERRLAAGPTPKPHVPPPAAPNPTSRPAQPAVVPSLEPERTPVASPADSPNEAVGDQPAWPRLIAAVHKDKPLLAAALEKARVIERPSWKLIFARSFELEQAKRAQPMIEAELATILGKTTRISFELGDVGTPPQTDLAQPSISQSSLPSSGDWSDAAEPKPKAEGGPLGKAQQILGGKLRIVKKPS